MTADSPSLLAGLVFDADGGRLTPSHAVKRGTRYRYYISQSLIANGKDAARPASRIDRTGWRIPALALEGLVKSRIVQFLQSPHQLMDALGDADAVETKGMLRKAAAFGATIGAGNDDLVRRFLLATVTRIDVSTSSVTLTLKREALWTRLSGTEGNDRSANSCAPETQVRFSSRFPRACVGPATSCASSLREKGGMIRIPV